jgi:hypothetical protein
MILKEPAASDLVLTLLTPFDEVTTTSEMGCSLRGSSSRLITAP